MVQPSETDAGPHLVAPYGRWPLVGRDGDLQAVGRAIADGGSAAVVVGASGSGKSRFLEEIGALVPEAGGMLLERFSRVSPGGPWKPVPTGGAGRAGAPRLLLVDDAHALSPDAGADLHHLASEGAAFVVVATHQDVPVPVPVMAMWKDGLGPRLALNDLDLDHTDELVHRILGPYVEPETVHRLWELTRGNPQYLWELISHGQVSGQLTADRAGLWAWRSDHQVGDRLRELITQRLGGLTEQEQAILQLVAVAGHLLLFLLETVDPDYRQTAALVQAGLLREGEDEGETTVEVARPLHALVLRSRGLLGLRRAARHLADAIDAHGDRRTELAYLAARYRTLAGQQPDAPTAALAAVRAAGMHRLEEAESLARLAIESGETHRGTLVLADVLGLRNRYSEAEEMLANLVVSEEGTGDEDGWAEAVVARSMAAFWGLGRGDEAVALLDHALARASQQPVVDNLVAARDNIQLVSGGRVSPDARYERALVLGAAGEGDSTTLRLLLSAAPAWLASNDLAMASRAIDAGIRTLRSLAEVFPLAEERMQLFRWFHLWLEGHLQEAMIHAEVQHRRAIAGGNRTAATLWTAASVRGLLVAGQARTAREWLQETWPQTDRHDQVAMMPTLLTERAATRTLCRDCAGAGADLAAIDSGAPNPGVWIGTSFAVASAWHQLNCGSPGEARRTIMDHCAETRALGQRTMEAMALVEAYRMGFHADAVGRLSELAPALEGRFLRELVSGALADSAGDHDTLISLSVTFEQRGARRYAAEASASALRHAPDGPGRQILRIRALALAGSCEGDSTPAISGLPRLHNLTMREVEVACLAGAGQSSRAIADELNLSARTVDNNLHRVYRKLGVSGRRELELLRTALEATRRLKEAERID